MLGLSVLLLILWVCIVERVNRLVLVLVLLVLLFVLCGFVKILTFSPRGKREKRNKGGRE